MIFGVLLYMTTHIGVKFMQNLNPFYDDSEFKFNISKIISCDLKSVLTLVTFIRRSKELHC